LPLALMVTPLTTQAVAPTHPAAVQPAWLMMIDA
jgi:hypothetical protein